MKIPMRVVADSDAEDGWRWEEDLDPVTAFKRDLVHQLDPDVEDEWEHCSEEREYARPRSWRLIFSCYRCGKCDLPIDHTRDESGTWLFSTCPEHGRLERADSVFDERRHGRWWARTDGAIA